MGEDEGGLGPVGWLMTNRIAPNRGLIPAGLCDSSHQKKQPASPPLQSRMVPKVDVDTGCRFVLSKNKMLVELSN